MLPYNIYNSFIEIWKNNKLLVPNLYVQNISIKTEYSYIPLEHNLQTIYINGKTTNKVSLEIEQSDSDEFWLFEHFVKQRTKALQLECFDIKLLADANKHIFQATLISLMYNSNIIQCEMLFSHLSASLQQQVRA